jgi:thiol-disulfide isomerase/thioredoxin
MNKYFFPLLLSCLHLYCYAESDSSHIKQILHTICATHQLVTEYTYTTHKDIRYHEENYFHNSTSETYVKKNSNALLGYNWQGQNENYLDIFNGEWLYSIDTLTKVFKKERITSFERISSSTFVNNSKEMVSSFLCQLLKNKSVVYGLGDTVINGKSYNYISFLKEFHYYDGKQNFKKHTVQGLRHRHFVLYNNENFQLRGFIIQYLRGIDERDFVMNLYSEMDYNTQDPGNWTINEVENLYQHDLEPEKTPMISIGQPLPSFSLLSFTPHKSDTLHWGTILGKVVLIEFWFKACGPCMQAMPHLNEIKSKFKDKPFQLMSINVEDSVSDIEFFYNKYKPPFPMLYNGKNFFKSLGFLGCPTSVLIDKDGVIIEIFHGFKKEKIENEIEKLLN